MWPVRAYGGFKIKIYAALYRKYWNYVSIPQFFVSIWHSFYMQKLTLMCIWYAMVMIRDVGFFRWWRRRGRIKLIKRTSSSARAPPTEKHNILHSFNQLKKSIAAFRHDFLLILIVCLRRFLCSYFNDKCPQRIIAYAKGKYLCSQVDSFPPTENVGESRGESTTFQKNVSLKDNVLDRDIFLLWSITHKCGLSIPSGIFYKCKTTSV